MNYKFCGRITAGVTVLFFLMIMPLFAEPPMRELNVSGESGTRLYGESEVIKLINELSETAVSEIEKVAGEAAKAQAVASLEREAANLAEIERLNKRYNALKKSNVKSFVITGLSCFAAGAVVCGGIILISRR